MYQITKYLSIVLCKSIRRSLPPGSLQLVLRYEQTQLLSIASYSVAVIYLLINLPRFVGSRKRAAETPLARHSHVVVCCGRYFCRVLMFN